MKTCPTCRIRYPDALEFCPQDGTALPGGAPGRTHFLYDRFVGSTVDGRYKIEAKLGEGGMGVVYAARHVIIDKRVAIKVLKREAQQDETAAQRFIQEARATSKIGHANIVDINDFGQMPDGSAYFVMEFLDGTSLAHELAKGPMQPARAIRIAAQIARGLHAAHKAGIVHRDLKPDNVFLLERDGQHDLVKIVDFGIAKVQTQLGTQRLTAAGMVLGTPEYMSPEQATGKDTDHRVDEYALGCILYEMITGEVPFRGSNSAATLTKHVFEQVVPPRKRRPDLTIPARLEEVTLKAMAKKRDERYADMLALLAALDDVAGEVGATGLRRSPREEGQGGAMPAHEIAAARSRRDADESDLSPARRRPGAAVLGIIGFAIVAIVAAGVLWRIGSRDDSPAGSALAGDPNAVAPGPASPARVEAPRPAPSKDVVLTLRTNPSGATVWIGKSRIGVTPLDYRTARSHESIEFLFKLSGHKDAPRTVLADGDHDIEVALVSRRSSRSSSAASESSGNSPGTPSQTPAAKSKGVERGPASDLRDPFN